MAQKAVGVEPGPNFVTRGVSVTITVDKNMRKTGYRPDATITVNDNSNDPDALVRDVNDARLT